MTTEETSVTPELPEGAPVLPRGKACALPTLWDLYVRDQAGQPIGSLNLWVHMKGKPLACTTDDQGRVSGLPITSEPIKIEVEKVTGGKKEVAKIELAPTTTEVVLTSPKVKVEGNTRVKQPTVTSSETPTSSPRQGPSGGAQSDWLRKAMRAGISASNQQFAYQCHSQSQRQKSLWKLPEWMASPFRKSKNPESIQVCLGRAIVPVMGQGSTVPTRKNNGSPVTVVGLEGWKGRLVLGRGREELRPAFDYAMSLDSVKGTNITDYALAAVVNAEAGSIVVYKDEPVLNKDGTPKISSKTQKPITKKVPDYDYWNERAYNPASGHAAGLCQFIESTWLGQVRLASTQLHKEALRRQLLFEEEILVSEGHPGLYDAKLNERKERLKKAREHYETAKQQYQSSQQSTNRKASKKSKPPIAPKTRKLYFVKRQSDVTSLLDIRFEGYWNLVAGAELMAQNLKAFQTAGFKVNELTNPFEIARVAYLLHFLGVGGASSLIKGTMSEDTAKKNLLNQVGQSEQIASKYISTPNSELKWKDGLWNFAQKICNENLNRGFLKFCYPQPASSEMGRDITVVIDSIKE